MKSYKNLLTQIKEIISETQSDIVRSVNREKVEMCWQIGKVIDQNLLENNRAEYGKKLFHDLSRDVSISERNLYEMRSFYKSYPTLPKNNLNWSHYRSLVTVKDDEKRKLLEDLALTDQLGAKDLQREIVKSKPRAKPKTLPTKLKFTRGKLFTYTETKEGELDLGFNIFLSSPPTVIASKAKQSSSSQVQMDCRATLAMTVVSKGEFTYLAELERVVDGDTLHVKLDLGFGIKHREILRLAKINSAESETKEGKKATAELKKILKDTPFLIVKTNKTDIYGRYVADVFFDKKEADPHKVASEGTYLNQLLLDRGLAKIWK